MSRVISTLAAFAVGLAAFLFFWIQPLVTRILLPALGGNQVAWNASMVFFQAALLIGYGIAHGTGTSRKGQAVLGGTALLALVSLPAAPPVAVAPPDELSPVLWLVVTLMRAIGLPVVVLAMASPLVQRWLSRTGRSPWFLYAWSNLGSLAALLAFPVLLEPRASLSGQFALWTLLVPFAVLGGAIVWFLASRRGPAATEAALTLQAVAGVEPDAPRAVVAAAAAVPTGRELLGWLARSALASSLLLSVTSHLTTDIAAIPLLWIIPLSLYLLAFALAFAPVTGKPDPLPAARLGRLVILPLVLWMGAQPRAQGAAWVPLVVHLVVFFLVCRGLLAQLVAARPAPSQLTAFYLVLAAGGLLGSAFNTFLCPWIFNEIVEYPLGLILAAILLGGATPRAGRLAAVLDVVLPGALGLLVIELGDRVVFATHEAQMARGLVVVALPGLLALFFFHRPRRYALAITVLVLAAGVYQESIRDILLKDRGLYGAYRVQAEQGGDFRSLVHGNTVHGRQAVDTPYCQVPLTYFHPTGPVGDAWFTVARRDTASPVAVIGLGVGSMAAFAEPGRRLDFYELDPRMIALATDTRWFRFLSDCQGTVRIIPGDARLSLAASPVVSYRNTDTLSPVFGELSFGYGLIVLDAFSSDGIPVHLLTREALAVYLSRLGPRGLIAFHISNRYLDLEPVIRDLAADARLIAIGRADDNADQQKFPGKLSSHWIVCARAPHDLEPLLGDPRWRVLVGARPMPWTDDRADILSVLKW